MAKLWLPDSRLEQPELFEAGRKPVGRVKIDWSHKYADGLVGFWLMEHGGRDLTGNNHGTDVGNIDHGFGEMGSYSRVVDSDTADRISLGSIDSNNPLSCSKNNEVSILALLEFNVDGLVQGNSNSRIIDKSDSGSGANGYEMDMSSTGGSLIFAVNGEPVTTDVLTLTEGDAFSVVSTHASGDTDIYINSELSISSSAITTPISTTTTNAALLNWNHAIDRQIRTPVYLVAVWDIKLDNAAVVSMSNNPYQFLIPS